MHASVIFLVVGRLLKILQVMSTFLQKERRVLMRKRKKCQINSHAGILW